MPASTPTILLATASFTPPTLYIRLQTACTNSNIPFQILSLPSVTKKPGVLPSMHDDAVYIASAVIALASAGQDVILIGHSYGGIPVSEAMGKEGGLSKKEREKAGKKGGVVELGYMAALVPGIGGTAVSVQVEERGGEGLRVDEDGWMHQTKPEATTSLLFNTLSPEEGLKWAQMFTQHSSAAFTSELTYPGYQDVPVSWLFCEKDACIPEVMQNTAIDVIGKASGKKVDVTRVQCDHMPPVTAVEETVKWFEKLIEKCAKGN